MPRRLKTSELPAIKKALLARQGYKCAICKTPLGPDIGRDVVLDHDHQFGFIRAVLCRNCNGIEGRVRNLVNRAKRQGTIPEWLGRLLLYWQAFDTSKMYGVLDTHPMFGKEKKKKATTYNPYKPRTRKR